MFSVDFRFAPVGDDGFLSLFPHRYDFLYAKHTRLSEEVEWHTESRFPLTDQKIRAGQALYGVRPGRETNYLMLDIDKGSPYHPKRDPQAVGRMMEALEQIGLVAYTAVTSSYSGGCHIYIPFYEKQVSWQLAGAAAWFLQSKGFLLQPGLLEIFPNPNNFNKELGRFSKFNGHRLPLQLGSYCLDESWQITFTSHKHFCDKWDFCILRNDPDRQMIAFGASKFNERRRAKLSYKAEKFLKDLNESIEPGWTDHGQTNALLGRITLRAYVFGHMLSGTEETLTGDRLIEEVVRTATELPGYSDWCRHQTDLWQRAEEWARSAENSRYWPYGSDRKAAPEPEQAPTYTPWNRWQENRARDRICFAIADQLNKEQWPAETTARFNCLVTYGLSGETIYRHRDLWHPEHLGSFPQAQNSFKNLPEGAGHGGPRPSEGGANLLPKEGVIPHCIGDQRAFWEVFATDPGCNPLLGEGSRDRAPNFGPPGAGEGRGGG